MMFSLTVDLIQLVAFVTGGSALIVFAVWMFYNSSEDLHRTDDVEQCPYCTYVFEKGSCLDAARCPRCGSFLTPLPQKTE